MPTDSHQASNSIKQVENSVLYRFSLLMVMTCISLSSCLLTRFVSANLQVAASVSISDWRITNWGYLLAAMLATLEALSLAAVFISASSLANLLLVLVALVLTSCNTCLSWCCNNWSIGMHLATVTVWISRTHHSFGLWRSVSDQVVATFRTQFRLTWNWLHFVVPSISLPYTMAFCAARIL